MKKLILGACTLTVAASVFAQGTVIFNNRITGTLVTKVYGLSPSNPTFSQAGNASTDTPQGTTDWTGYSGLDGAGFTAELWAAPGAGQAEASLVAATPQTTFRTGAGAGFVAGTTATLTGVAADAPVATLQLRVWDNQGGTITTWAAAVAASVNQGKSPTFDVTAIGGQANQAPALLGLQSFNIHAVPEPTTFALAGLGAAALLIFRRRK
jgi:hypothetical protein